MASFCKKLFSLAPLPSGGFSRSVYSFPQRPGSPSGAQESSPRRQPWVRKATLDQPRMGRKKEALNLTNALRPDCPSRKFREQQNSSESAEDSEPRLALYPPPQLGLVCYMGEQNIYGKEGALASEVCPAVAEDVP